MRLGLRFREAPDDARIEPAKGFAQATHWLHLGADADVERDVAALADLIGLAHDQNG